jgi:hypothetical protein
MTPLQSSSRTLRDSAPCRGSDAYEDWFRGSVVLYALPASTAIAYALLADKYPTIMVISIQFSTLAHRSLLRRYDAIVPRNPTPCWRGKGLISSKRSSAEGSEERG